MDSFRYWQLVDWIGNVVVAGVVLAGVFLFYRELRRSNRINEREVTAAERHAHATAQLAKATESVAMALATRLPRTVFEPMPPATDTPGKAEPE